MALSKHIILSFAQWIFVALLCFMFYMAGQQDGAKQGIAIVNHRQQIVRLTSDAIASNKDAKMANALVSAFDLEPTKANYLIRKIKVHTDGCSFPSVSDVLAVMKIESDFRPDVVSSANAVGIMQVKGASAHLDENIRAGVSRLREYYNLTGDKFAALNAYNVGITAHNKGVINENYTEKFQNAQFKLMKYNQNNKKGNT